jgi:RNA polymerase sigma factor (sigma-70 family)
VNEVSAQIPLLEDYLAADSEAMSSEILVRLVEERLDPLIRSAIRRKLNVSLDPADERRENEDARDFVSDARLLIIEKLQGLRSGGGTPIDDLDAYVGRVAVNVCNKYLRRKYPYRLRLKNQLRYLLSHNQRFSLWRSDTGEWLCSVREEPSVFSGNGRRPSTIDIVEELELSFEREHVSAADLDLADVAARVLERSAGPLLLADAVSCVYQLRRIQEPSAISGEEAMQANLPANERTLPARLEDTEMLRAIWDEIKSLPPRHRLALMLSLRHSSGEGLITMLPIANIATLSQIAEVLELEIREFARILKELPWTDGQIAEHLGVTRQQVINLRHWARVRLRKAAARER